MLLTFFFLVQSFDTKAATGSIEGVVFDKKTGETLVGAQVLIVGTTIVTITDFDGHFIIEGVQTGTYNIKISYISYNPVVFESVIVEANKKVQLKADMEEVSVNIGDVTIVAERRKGSDVSVISAIKSNAVVSSGISNQQIMRSQDRDASEVVKRVPGVTIVGDRFIVVRGLNQRYNNVWLNNSSAPSSESDSRAFSFDVVPSSMIENMMIFKAPAPELPGDFSGGFVKLTTKDVPDKNNYSFNIGLGYRPGTTFNDFYKYKGGSLDWLGYDDETRKLPGYFPADLKTVGTNDQIQLGRILNKNWIANPSTALPEMRASFGMSHRFKLNKITIGEVTSINYSNTYEFEKVENNNYGVYQFENDKPGYDFAFNDSVYSNTAKIGVMSNWTAFLGKGSKIEFRNLYNNIGTTKTSFRRGTEYYSNTEINSFEYGFMSRSNYLGQLNGTHSFDQGNTKIDWLLGYSTSNRQEPDLKRLKLTRNDQPGDVNFGRYGMKFPNAPLTSYAGRVYMDLNEDILNGNVNFEHTFSKGSFKPVLKAGIFTEKKDREFAARKLGYVYSDPSQSDRSIEYLPFDQMFADENINATTGIKLAEETGKSDAYTANNTLLAGYAGIQLPISKKFSVYTGLRAEQNEQTLSSYDRYQQPITIVNDTLNLLPSINAIFSLNEKNLIRAAYGKSLNRPEFREIAPFPFYDFQYNAVFSGNPDLKDASIHNAEIRFEHYPSDNETFSFGAFYKKFYNPIEIKYLQTGSGLEYSYQNANEADNFGIEAEVRKSLAADGWLKNFSVVLNGALIKSEVRFENTQTELNRPMAGQSPYIFNAGIFYQDMDKRRLMVNVLYNIIGKRISIVGIPQQNEWENIPDIYEMPRHLVDMVISKKIGKYMELKFGVKDLLNQYVVFQQNVNATVDMSYYNGGASDIQQFERTQIIRRYKPGSNYSLELGIRF